MLHFHKSKQRATLPAVRTKIGLEKMFLSKSTKVNRIEVTVNAYRIDLIRSYTVYCYLGVRLCSSTWTCIHRSQCSEHRRLLEVQSVLSLVHLPVQQHLCWRTQYSKTNSANLLTFKL